MTTIDRLIDASVSCTKCGAKGVGTCHCWDTPAPTERERQGIEMLAKDIARDVIDHIDTMYPHLWDDAPKTARTSVRNTIINKVVAALI